MARNGFDGRHGLEIVKGLVYLTEFLQFMAKAYGGSDITFVHRSATFSVKEFEKPGKMVKDLNLPEHLEL